MFRSRAGLDPPPLGYPAGSATLAYRRILSAGLWAQPKASLGTVTNDQGVLLGDVHAKQVVLGEGFAPPLAMP